MKLNIEQIALFPPDPERAIKLLTELGMTEWVRDVVKATGMVNGTMACPSIGNLAFNYTGLEKARELEVLHYIEGPHWMAGRANAVSHFGTHCSAEELAEWMKFFAARHINIAQELFTYDHSNEAIRDKRWYHYVIFNTRPILGVDLKFIVRDNGITIECLVCGTQKQSCASFNTASAWCAKCGEMTNHQIVQRNE